MISRLKRYGREVAFAFETTTSRADGFRLAAHTLQFHASSKAGGVAERAYTYQVRINEQGPFPLAMRTLAGDLFVFYEVIMDREYDTSLLALGNAPRIIDLGGHIGLATMYFATRHPGARLFTVEPDPSNHELLHHNVRALGDRVRLIRAAAAATTGVQHLDTRGQSWQRSIATTGVEVDTLSMADVIAASGFNRVDLMKIDVEGMEEMIFAGNLDWLKQVDAIMIELHHTPTVPGFTALMETHGLAVVQSVGVVIARRSRD